MSLSIEPLEGYEWECGYGVIASAAKYFKCDYQLSYKDLWKFDYVESENEDISLGCQIETSKIDIVEPLYLYCNFEVIDIPVNDVNQVISMIKEELSEGRPAKLRMDLFWCPWHKEVYKNIHIMHSILVTGCNEHNNTFQFIDHSPMISDGILDIGALPINSDYTVSIFKMVNKKPDKVDWRVLIEENIKRVLGKSSSKSMFEKQRSFADRILDLIDFSNEYSDDDKFLRTDLCKNLIRIIQHRVLYAEFLEFLAQRYGVDELSESIENMRLASDKWEKIRNLFVKASMLQNQMTILPRISSKIKVVTDFEEKIAYDLLNIIRMDVAGGL